MNRDLGDIEEIDRLITVISRFFVKNHSCLETEGISPKQFYLLRTLYGKHMAVSDLARELGLSRSATTIALNRMVEAQLVQRERDEQDRRIVRVRLSNKAKSLIQNMIARRKKLMEQLLSNLTVEESRQFIYLIRKLSMDIEPG